MAWIATLKATPIFALPFGCTGSLLKRLVLDPRPLVGGRLGTLDHFRLARDARLRSAEIGSHRWSPPLLALQNSLILRETSDLAAEILVRKFGEKAEFHERSNLKFRRSAW